MKRYDVVIGLEIHVELATKTKIFCSCPSKFGGEPNTYICPVCMGMPGTLPVLNEKVVEYAMAVGLATGCSIADVCKFDRKNYFYPDNPQNYQISQLYMPICRNGFIEIYTETDIINSASNVSNDNDMNNEKNNENNDEIRSRSGSKKIRIHEIHMEEDAGKLLHDEERDVTFVDYNRAGVPLIEIVTCPDMYSAEEVIEFLTELRSRIMYLGVSDCKLNEGSMRVDVNLSVKEKGSAELGTRTEMKNLNSFKAITRAIEEETRRQIQVIEDGGIIEQETRRWDDGAGVSYTMRSKEDANDYRYFPEPDLKPLYIDRVWVKKVEDRQPELRREKMLRYKQQFGIPEYDIRVLTEEKKVSELYESLVEQGVQPKKASNWIMVDLYKIVNDRIDDISKINISPVAMAHIIDLVESKKITKASGIQVLEALYDEDIEVDAFIEENDLLIVVDIDELSNVIDDIIAANPQSVADYKAGKTKAMGYIVGQTMKAMKGKAAPDIVNKIVGEKLSE